MIWCVNRNTTIMLFRTADDRFMWPEMYFLVRKVSHQLNVNFQKKMQLTQSNFNRSKLLDLPVISERNDWMAKQISNNCTLKTIEWNKRRIVQCVPHKHVQRESNKMFVDFCYVKRKHASVRLSHYSRISIMKLHFNNGIRWPSANTI